MRSIKARVAAASALVLAGAVAVTLVVTLGGGNAKKATGTANVRSGQGAAVDGQPPSERSGSSTASAGESPAATTGGARAAGGTGEAPAQASTPAPANIQGILGQLEQAVTSGGQPRPLTREEVEAQLRAELQKVGINQP